LDGLPSSTSHWTTCSGTLQYIGAIRIDDIDVKIRVRADHRCQPCFQFNHAVIFNRSHLLANPKIIAPDGTAYTLLVAWFGATPIDVLGADGTTIPLLLTAIGISAVVCWWLAR
jgi:hypothetical protein